MKAPDHIPSPRLSTTVIASVGGAALEQSDEPANTNPVRIPDQPLSLIDRVLTQAKNGLFGVLYVMSKNTHHTESWLLATFIIEFFHLLAFTFSQEAAFPWDRQVVSILQIARYARFDLINLFGGHNELIWFIFATIIVLGILTMTIHVSFAFTRNRIGSILPLRILREFAGTLVSFLFVPFLSTFAKSSRCHSTALNSLGFACEGFAQHVLSILSITMGIIMFCFAVLFDACFYSCDPTQSDYSSKSHARFDVIYQCVVATIAVVSNLIDISNPSTHVGLALLFLTGSFILTAAIIFFLPYYSIKFVYVRASLLSVWLWCNICLLISVVADEAASNSFSALLFIGMPVSALLAVLAVKTRITYLQECPPNQLRSPFEVELKARFYIVSRGILYRRKGDTDDEESEARKQHLAYVKDHIYLENMHRFPSSSILRIFAAHFFAFHMDNKHMACVLFESAIRRNPRLDELFRIHRHRMLSIEKRDVNDGNVLAGIEYEQTSLQALNAIRSTLQAQKAFWSVLLEPVPDLSRLQLFGSHISRHINVAEHKCRHLLTLDPDAPEALRMYGLFLQHALNDPEGEELQQKASNIEEQGRKMDVASPTAMKYIPIFKIAQNTGIILQVNQSACKLVGRTAVQLEGFSINNILPDVVASNHDHLMKKFSQEGEHHSIITIERELFFQHSKGHIVIVQGTLRSSPEVGTEPYILASVCSNPVLNDPNHHHFVIEMPSTKIYNWSEQALDWMRISKHSRLSQQLFLSEYVKQITPTNLEDYMVPNGVAKMVKFDEGRGPPIKVRISIRPLLTQPFAMVRFYVIPTSITIQPEPSAPPSFNIQTSVPRQITVDPSSRLQPSLSSFQLERITGSFIQESEQPSISREEVIIPDAGDDLAEDDQGSSEAMSGAFNDANHSMILSVRRKLMRKAIQVDRGVILLAVSLLASLVAIIALTASTQVYTNKQSDAILHNLDHIRMSTNQLHDLAVVMFRIESVRCLFRGDPSAAMNSTMAMDAADKIDRLKTTHSLLYMSRTMLQDPVADRFQQKSVVLSTSVSLANTLSYSDAIHLLIFTAESALNRIASADSRIARDLYLLRMNGPTIARAILAEFADLFIGAAHSEIFDIIAWKQIYLIVSLVIIFLLLFFAFIPTIQHFERENKAIASVFLSIPRPAIENLRQAATKSLQIWKNSSDDDASLDYSIVSDADYQGDEHSSEENSNIRTGSVEGDTTEAEHIDKLPVNDCASKEKPEASRVKKPRRRKVVQMEPLSDGYTRASTFLGKLKSAFMARRRYLFFMLQICFLLLIWIAYTLFSYFSDVRELLNTESKAQEVFLSTMIPAQIQAFLFFAARAAYVVDERSFWTAKAAGALRSVESIFEILLYSGSIQMSEIDSVFTSSTYEVDGAVHRFADRDALLFKDACVYLDPVYSSSCYSFGINTTTPYLFSTGLSNTLSSLITLAYNVRDLLPILSATDGDLALGQLLASPHVIKIDEMMSDLMGRVLSRSSDTFIDETEVMQEYHAGQRRILLIFFIIILFGSAIFLYWPMMKRLDLDIKCTRSMILLVPAQILSNVPEIRDRLLRAI